MLFVFCTTVSAQTGARYLIITPDYFYSTLRPLVDWKYRKGMKPAVYRTSQIGSDSASIRNFIMSCYYNWDIQPEYVVLIGHAGYIPMNYYQYGSYHYYTDNYYTNMDGDFYNEILPGRISVADTNELKTVISKIFAYERRPYLDDTTWFLKGCAIANCDGEDDSIYLHCMRYAESLAVHNGFLHVDTLCDYYGHNQSHIISSINDGRNFVLYRGNANIYWYDPFNVDPYSTANGERLPIVISATCRTVSPNSTPIIGEKFLRAGTPSSLKGAVGFIGGTRNTNGASHLRNAVAIGCLNGLLIEGKRTFGAVTEAGRLRVYQQYGEIREYNNFTCLGDPELNLWTAAPCSILVEHPVFVPLGFSGFTVHVKDISGSQPVADAYVCVAGLLDSSVYVLDTTDTGGNAYFTISPQYLDDTLSVTVTGENLCPYEGQIIVKMVDYCYIVYLKSSVDDSSFGNNDGIINPTENIELPLWVYNAGESTGVNIEGTIRINSPYVTVTDSIRTFGNIIGRDSAYTGSDGYNFTVAHSCPNRSLINLELQCSDVHDSTWTSSFMKMVYAPDFGFQDFTISGGNGNNIVEPGETVQVIVELANQGDAPADSVQAVLRCTSPDAILLDSTSAMGHIGIDSVQDNSADPFELAVDTSTAIGTVLDLTLCVYSSYCNDMFDFQIIVGRKSYFIWNPDPSPQSGEHIDSLLSCLGFHGDIGTALPSSLELYRSVFVCLGVYSSRYLITQNSAEAIMLTDYLNNGGRVYLEGSSTWFVDPEYFDGHDFGPMFGIYSTDFSYGDLGPIAGESNTFTTNMYFDYIGENAYMDHLDPVGNGVRIFYDVDNYYGCAVACDANTYKTVGTSFELGFLQDGIAPSTREALLDSIMKFLGVAAPGIEEEHAFQDNHHQLLGCQVSPNPFSSELHLACAIDPAYNYSLRIYDASGRLVRDLSSYIKNNGSDTPAHVVWDAKDDKGHQAGAGVYFVHLENHEENLIKKIIFIKK
jgi:hypothetical protein